MVNFHFESVAKNADLSVMQQHLRSNMLEHLHQASMFESNDRHVVALPPPRGEPVFSKIRQYYPVLSNILIDS